MHTTTILDFRKSHSISQEALAAFLRISISLLAMAETNQRSLPKKAMGRLAELQQHSLDGILLKAAPEMNTRFHSFIVARQREHKAALMDLGNSHIIKLHRLYKQLNNLQLKEDKAMNTVALMHAKLSASTKSANAANDETWIMGVLGAAKDSLRSIPAGTTQKIAMQIDLLEAQLTGINKKIRHIELETGLYDGTLEPAEGEAELKMLVEDVEE